MNSFPLKMALVLAILACIGGFGIVSANLEFEPEGVRRGQREQYDKKLAQLRLEQKLKSEGKSFPHAKVELVEESFDFGMLDPHSTASHSFEIHNAGTVDLFLKAGETSCKCTVGTVGAETVPPGYSTLVTLEWNTGYQAEDYQQSAIVHTNDPAQPTVTLSVKGRVRAELMLTNAGLQFPASDVNKATGTTTFLYSQLWDDFVVDTVDCELPGFQWIAEPIDVKELPIADLGAKSAWRLTLSSLPSAYGAFSGSATVTVSPASGAPKVRREISISGKVRVPVSFSGPDLDAQKGLDLGLLTRGSERRKSIIVRVRGDQEHRKIAVLDIMPKQLKAELEKTELSGVYKLTIIVPADTSTVMFNTHQEHGYVHVGDPEDKKFMNWMPIMGGLLNPPSS